MGSLGQPTNRSGRKKKTDSEAQNCSGRVDLLERFRDENIIRLKNLAVREREAKVAAREKKNQQSTHCRR